MGDGWKWVMGDGKRAKRSSSNTSPQGEVASEAAGEGSPRRRDEWCSTSEAAGGSECARKGFYSLYRMAHTYLPVTRHPSLVTYSHPSPTHTSSPHHGRSAACGIMHHSFVHEAVWLIIAMSCL
jgi:hypothetical protein